MTRGGTIEVIEDGKKDPERASKGRKGWRGETVGEVGGEGEGGGALLLLGMLRVGGRFLEEADEGTPGANLLFIAGDEAVGKELVAFNTSVKNAPLGLAQAR